MSSREDINPFADPNDVNPFAAPASNNSGHLDDYNPFAAQQQTVVQPSKAQTVTAASTAPATIEPVRQDKPILYGSSSAYNQDDALMRQRQEELDRKASELDKKEKELQRLQAGGKTQNNFPPLPKFCCVQPCFYHDIQLEIPIESQKTCKLFFFVWQLYVFTLFFNFLSALAGLCKGVDNGGTLFGVSILYCILFVPCSFVIWYRPIYKALRSDSSFNYMLFFFTFFFQIIFTFVYSLGISQFGTCGWINGSQAMDNNGGVATMFFICGALFTFLGIVEVILLRKDPSIVNQTKQPTLDDYNPFDGTQQQQSQQPTPYSNPATPHQAYTATLPATIEPVSSQQQTTYQSKPFAGHDDEMLQRQQELEKKAAELERKEKELNQYRASGNNFPPFPKFCCVQPCFFHDINLEIPSSSQKTCKLLFYIWQLYIFTLLFNLLSSIAYMGDGGGSGGETLGLAILYFLVNIPCSFLFWYRPIYKALKNDSSFNFMVFFFVFFCQIVFTIIMCLGIPGVSCGWINAIKQFKDHNEGVGIMMFICATLWTLLALFKVLILKKVHTSYRSSGASFAKAQGEFAHGVATNKDVQKAAAEAVAQGYK